MTYRVAVTTSDGQNINLHFGQCEEIYVFQVEEDSETWKIVEKIPMNKTTSNVCHNRTAVEHIASTLAGCEYLLTEHIGNRIHDKLGMHGLTILESNTTIETALRKINLYRLRHKKTT